MRLFGGLERYYNGKQNTDVSIRSSFQPNRYSCVKRRSTSSDQLPVLDRLRVWAIIRSPENPRTFAKPTRFRGPRYFTNFFVITTMDAFVKSSLIRSSRRPSSMRYTLRANTEANQAIRNNKHREFQRRERVIFGLFILRRAWESATYNNKK